MNIPRQEESRDDLYSYRVMKDERILVFKNRKLVKMIDTKTSRNLIDNLDGKTSLETHKILAQAAIRK
jgi:hypothetical protein